MTYVHDLAKTKRIPIIDARQLALVSVSVDDIQKSKAKNSKCCAFARAAQHEPGVVAAYFFRSMAFLEYPDRIVRYLLPMSAQKEIVSFDRSGIMAPGQYRLSSVPPSLGLAQMRRYSKKKTKARQKARAATPATKRTPLIEHVGLVQATRGAPPIPGLPRASRIAPKYVRDTSDPK